MLHYPDTASLAIADIPGLIKGASNNRGLGHRFLRHVERSQALAYVLDLSSGVKPSTGPTAQEQFTLLQVWMMLQRTATSRLALHSKVSFQLTCLINGLCAGPLFWHQAQH